MNAPTREEFLTRRQAGIGGSDIATLLGLNPWGTPYELWLKKTGRFVEPERDADAVERMAWGNILEDVVARRYAEQAGVRVQRINQQLSLPAWPQAIANIDRAILAPRSVARWDAKLGRVVGADAILEVKTAHALAERGDGWGAPGTDQVPQNYYLQVQWYQGITGVHDGRVAVLFGGQKLRTYHIPHDPELFAGLVDVAQTWWRKHVEGDTPPEPTSEAEVLARWPRHQPGLEVIATEPIAEAAWALAEVNKEIARLEKQKAELRDAILPVLGGAEALSYMGKRLLTFKSNRDFTSTDWQAVAMASGAHPDCIAAHTTTKPGARVLRITTPKE